MTIGSPHLSHLYRVAWAVTCTLPSSVRLAVVLQSRSEQVRNSPRRPWRKGIGLPHDGHLCSVSFGASYSGSPSRGLMYLQGLSFSLKPEQPMNSRPSFLLKFFTSGRPHLGHISPVSSPRL